MTQQTTTAHQQQGPSPEPPHWLKSLPDAARERVFAVMRGINEEADRLMEKHKAQRPRYGEVSGAAHMDPFFSANACEEFLRALNRGMDPKAAHDEAANWSAEAVRIHNAKCPRDVHWQRWTGCEGARLGDLMRRVLRAVEAGGV